MATNGSTTTRTRTIKSWRVSCPSCGSSDGINLNLNDLAIITCSECSDEFTAAAAVKKAAEELRRWTALAAWIQTAGECLADGNPDTEAETSAE